MDYQTALALTNEFMEYLRPICVRIEVVGSVKRVDTKALTEGCHDIEFLLILKDGRPVAEFGKPDQIYLTKLDKLLADLKYRGRIGNASDPKDGKKYKKRAIKGTGELNEFCVEFFIVTAETWGIQNLIRTGPSLFSHRFVTNRSQHFYSSDHGRSFAGLLPNDLTYVRGETCIRRGEERLVLPEESDAIALIGAGWIAPADRAEFALR